MRKWIAPLQLERLKTPISTKRPGSLEVLGVLEHGNSLDPLMNLVRGVGCRTLYINIFNILTFSLYKL
jgi:hypothetical protein